MDLKVSPSISIQALSGRSVSCAIPPTDLIEQGKTTPKARCNGKAMQQNITVSHACMLGIEHGDRRSRKNTCLGTAAFCSLGLSGGCAVVLQAAVCLSSCWQLQPPAVCKGIPGMDPAQQPWKEYPEDMKQLLVCMLGRISTDWREKCTLLFWLT